MRRLYPLLAAAVLAAAPAARGGTIALDVTSDSQVFSVGVFRNVGWQFTVNSAVIVDGLGLFDVGPAGLAESHQVGLWNNSGVLLAQATVTNGSTPIASASNSGDWLFENIAPVLLLPGTYVTGGFYATSADSVMADTTVTLAPEITFVASRASTEATFAEPGVYGLVEPGVFGTNLRLQSAPAPAVPAPPAAALLGMGVLSLWGYGWRRKRAAA